jgi:hypothetical protein
MTKEATKEKTGETDGRPGGEDAALEQLRTENAELRDALKVAEDDAERFRAEVAELQGSLRAQKGQATRARREVERLKTGRDKPARAAGPVKGDDALSVQERSGRIWDALTAGGATIVASDGKREIRELGAIAVDGGHFEDRQRRGLVLDAEPILELDGGEQPDVAVAGFALLDGDGKVAGYCPLPEPVTVLRGARVLIPAGSIRF